VCREYLSNGRREGGAWRVGDIDNTPGRSLMVRLFAEEIRKRAGAAPFEAIGEPFSDDWHSEEICPANAPDLLAAVQDALDQIRRGGPRWTIEEGLATALARARAHGTVS
jgi:hypothetical protein